MISATDALADRAVLCLTDCVADNLKVNILKTKCHQSHKFDLKQIKGASHELHAPQRR